MSGRLLLALALLAASWGCGDRDEGVPEGPRVYENREVGLRYELPPDWTLYRHESKSDQGALLSVQVKSLEGAQAAFLAGLPRSVVPQLREWTRYFFGEPQSESLHDDTLGGEAALRVDHTITLRGREKTTRVSYWVARHGDLLYLVRVTFPPGIPDEPSLRALLDSWTYLPVEGSPG